MKKTKDAKNQLRRAQRPASDESTSYASWIVELKRRYRATQIKAAVAVNSALMEFYWNLGKDISEKYVGTKIYGSGFFSRLSADLKGAIPGADGLSTQNLRYCLHFYELYGGAKILPQLVGKLVCIPWGHHRIIIDKCKGDRNKALFYVRRTIQNGWSRNSLLNWLSTDLYEREGKAQTNFEVTMPSDECDLARQIVKDPQNFGNGEKRAKHIRGQPTCWSSHLQGTQPRPSQVPLGGIGTSNGYNELPVETHSADPRAIGEVLCRRRTTDSEKGGGEMKDLGAKCFRRRARCFGGRVRRRALRYGGQVVFTKMDAAQIRRIKATAFSPS